MPSIRDIAKTSIMHTAAMLSKDAGHVPAEKLDWTPMEQGRSVLDILAECVGGNEMILAVMKGETPQEAVEAEKDLQTLQNRVIESAQAVCKAIDSLADADLDLEHTMPWGAKMTVAEAIFLSADHMKYHDGQINYIQLLLGDKVFHWAE